MEIKIDSVLVIEQRLRLEGNGWEVPLKSSEDEEYDLLPGTELTLYALHWTTGPIFDPDCGINFSIENDKDGPEFMSEELHRFLIEGIISIKG